MAENIDDAGVVVLVIFLVAVFLFLMVLSPFRPGFTPLPG